MICLPKLRKSGNFNQGASSIQLVLFFTCCLGSVTRQKWNRRSKELTSWCWSNIQLAEAVSNNTNYLLDYIGALTSHSISTIHIGTVALGLNITTWRVISCLLCARHCITYVPNIISIKTSSNVWGRIMISYIYGEGNLFPETEYFA